MRVDFATFRRSWGRIEVLRHSGWRRLGHGAVLVHDVTNRNHVAPNEGSRSLSAFEPPDPSPVL